MLKQSYRILLSTFAVFFVVIVSTKGIAQQNRVFRGIERPANTDVKIDHLPPISQNYTGTCWSFSTISFLESEIIRLGHERFKLSEMFVVYNTYIEKAKNYLAGDGKAVFSEGGLSHDVIEVIRKYGIVRLDDYTGLLPTEMVHRHTVMQKKMKLVLDRAIESGNYDESTVLNEIKSILNSYMGEPPDKIKYHNRFLSPNEFADNILQIEYDNYVELMSFQYAPFNKKTKLTVKDNWRRYDKYLNLDLNTFMDQLTFSLDQGFGIVIDCDITENGYSGGRGMAVIRGNGNKLRDIDQEERENRFIDQKTSDDHLMHFVGYKKKDDVVWYLSKDSGGSIKGPFGGYMFMREDYVKLKVLAYMVHKDVLKPGIKTIIEN